MSGRGAPIPYALGPKAIADQRQIRTVGGLTRVGRAKAWGEAVALASRVVGGTSMASEVAELARLVLLLAPGDAGAGGSTVSE